jgi:hypothetical protein
LPAFASLGEIAMLEVANVEHALFAMLSQSYSLRRFPATDPTFETFEPGRGRSLESCGFQR